MTTLEEVFLHLGEEEEIEGEDSPSTLDSFRDKAVKRYTRNAKIVLLITEI